MGNMNSLTRIILSRQALNNLAPRAIGASAVGSTRFMSLGTDLARKEKVEEDRYIRQKEHQEYLTRKAAEDAVAAAKELTAAEMKVKEIHDATTLEVFEILAMTDDKVSDACIENLADWKLGK